MNDIFKDMQAKVGCEYISDLPSYKRKVWQEMKRLNPADYEERQLEDFSKYVFGMSYQTLKDVMKQQKGREEQCRNPNTSFDCSGLTQWCYGKAGISLPRTAQAQYDATQHLPLSQAKAGDLVFFHSTYNAGSYVTHVGILVSPTQMYHAGNPIGYADLSSSYWQQHLIGAGRVKQ